MFKSARSTMLSLLFVPLALLPSFQEIFAENRRAAPSGKLVKPDSIRNTTVTIQEGEKTSSVDIQCLKGTPGKATKSKKNMMKFTSFSSLARNASSKKSKARFKLLAKEGATACAATTPTPENPETPPGSNPTGPTPTPGAQPPVTGAPEHLSLEKYSGPFGPAEAKILFNRFAFGSSPQQITEAVALGLEGTINKLTTLTAEPELDALMADLECDSWLLSDPDAGTQNKTCNPEDINDFSRQGQRTQWLYRMLYSKNAFHERLRLFFHDERMSVAQSAARDCEKHAAKTYMSDLWNLATTGDYKAYMRAMNSSHLVHLRWLDGASNQGGVVKNRPNENYAREFWELGTVGPTALDGQPVYTDLDIAQASLALTGWTINTVTVNEKQVCLAARSPLLHTPGLKTIFAGTPWQASIDNDEDLLVATFAHPRTAEHIAEDIWKQFINYSATPEAIRALAAVIRENDYKLLPVFQRIMGSKAMFAAQSRGALIRHPVERVVSFIKTSGFPVYYRRLDALVSQLEQQPLNPPSVFGWDEKKLSSDSLLLAWRNTVIDEFVNINIKELKDEKAWSYYDRFVADLNQQGKTGSLDVINRVAQDFGAILTEKQRAHLDQYLNFSPTNYQCPEQCGGNPYRLERDKYDTDPSSRESGTDWGGQEKIRGLVALLLTTRDAFIK